MSVDRRMCWRSPFRQEILVETLLGSEKCVVNDIGLGGVALEATSLLVGDRLALELPLPDPTRNNTTRSFRVDGEVIWFRGKHAGVRFVRVDGGLIEALRCRFAKPIDDHQSGQVIVCWSIL